MEDLALTPVLDLSGDLDGLEVVAGSVGSGGELTALAVRPDVARRVAPPAADPPGADGPEGHDGSFPPYAATLLVASPDGRRSHVEIDGCTAYAPRVERLPVGDLLVVGEACVLRRRQDDAVDRDEFTPYGERYEAELNGLRYDALGNLVGRSCFGDGVRHVQVSPSGHVWVGYSDTGVFGNRGWGVGWGEERPEQLGRPGLVRYSLDGEVQWRYQEPEDLPSQAGYVADCEGLTLAGRDGEDAFACYYTDFPVVRCGPQNDVRLWATGGDLSGVTAMAVVADRVHVVFDRHGGPQRVFTGVMDDRAQQLRSGLLRALTLADGRHLGRARVWGRGRRLASLAGGTWYLRDLDIPPAA